MATMARAEPSSIITGLSNRYTTQVGANTEHDEPFRFLGTRLVGFGVAEGLDLHTTSFLDLVGGTVADEDGLATPFDNEYKLNRLQLPDL